MLILFDIDGTLLLSKGASLRGYRLAAQRLFGRELATDGMATAGGLDPLIWREYCVRNGIEAAEAEAQHEQFRGLYQAALAELLAPGDVAYSLPGVTALLDALADQEHVAVGLLTGNYPETGRLKLQAAGLAPERFGVAAWGTDGGHRRELLPVALARHAAGTGRTLACEQVVIVGDTPHDVDVATAHGARALAVATGSFDEAQLAASGAHRVVPDLSDTAAVLSWLSC